MAKEVDSLKTELQEERKRRQQSEENHIAASEEKHWQIRRLQEEEGVRKKYEQADEYASEMAAKVTKQREEEFERQIEIRMKVEERKLAGAMVEKTGRGGEGGAYEEERS